MYKCERVWWWEKSWCCPAFSAHVTVHVSVSVSTALDSVDSPHFVPWIPEGGTRAQAVWAEKTQRPQWVWKPTGRKGRKCWPQTLPFTVEFRISIRPKASCTNTEILKGILQRGDENKIVSGLNFVISVCIEGLMYFPSLSTPDPVPVFTAYFWINVYHDSGPHILEIIS